MHRGVLSDSSLRVVSLVVAGCTEPPNSKESWEGGYPASEKWGPSPCLDSLCFSKATDPGLYVLLPQKGAQLLLVQLRAPPPHCCLCMAALYLPAPRELRGL